MCLWLVRTEYQIIMSIHGRNVIFCVTLIHTVFLQENRLYWPKTINKLKPHYGATATRWGQARSYLRRIVNDDEPDKIIVFNTYGQYCKFRIKKIDCLSTTNLS